MRQPDPQAVLDRLRQSEGLRLTAYLDTQGVATIGYGTTRYRCAVRPGQTVRLTDTITETIADAELKAGYEAITDELYRKLPWLRHQPWFVQESLQDMAYNLGVPRLMGFTRMLGALANHQYALAVLEAFDSRWAREQVPRRAVSIMRHIAENVSGQ